MPIDPDAPWADGFAPWRVPDRAAVELLGARLTAGLAPWVDELAERDDVWIVAHLVCGWGDYRRRGGGFSDDLVPLLRPGPNGLYVDQAPVVRAGLAHAPLGDHHPWQLFAYAHMAGLGENTPVAGRTIGEIAADCLQIRPTEPWDLGHLLFAAAHLFPDPALRVRVGQHERTLRALAERALVAHADWDRRVCGHCHLTEGLVAATTRVPGLADLRPAVARCLAAQMDRLTDLAALVAWARTLPPEAAPDMLRAAAARTGTPAHLDGVIRAGGHFLEVAVLAEKHGFSLGDPAAAAVRHLAADLVDLVDAQAGAIDPVRTMATVGHLRRALLLLTGVSEPGARFDAGELDRPSGPVGRGGPFPAAGWRAPPGPALAAAWAALSAAPPTGLRPWGGADPGFRHLRRDGWPRRAHFELLDIDGVVWVEVHLEGEEVAGLAPGLAALDGATLPDGTSLAWDPGWYGFGRLRCRPADPVRAAHALAALVQAG